jgi:hypothetical protein
MASKFASPQVRVDREFGNEVERAVITAVVYAVADLVDLLTLTGGVYGQLIAPPVGPVQAGGVGVQ